MISECKSGVFPTRLSPQGITMKSETRNCEVCSKPFHAEWKYLKRGQAKFCSRSCSASRQRGPTLSNVLTCAGCSKEFIRRLCKTGVGKTGLNFCTRKCKDSAQRIGGVKDIHPDHYGRGIPKYRKVALSTYEHKCNRCGYSKYLPVLQVHHIDRNRRNADSSNLEILCPTCHAEDHFLAGDGLFTK